MSREQRGVHKSELPLKSVISKNEGISIHLNLVQILLWQFIFNLGPVVQNIVSLRSSLRGQLVKYFKTI